MDNLILKINFNPSDIINNQIINSIDNSYVGYVIKPVILEGYSPYVKSLELNYYNKKYLNNNNLLNKNLMNKTDINYDLFQKQSNDFIITNMLLYKSIINYTLNKNNISYSYWMYMYEQDFVYFPSFIRLNIDNIFNDINNLDLNIDKKNINMMNILNNSSKKKEIDEIFKKILNKWYFIVYTFDLSKKIGNYYINNILIWTEKISTLIIDIPGIKYNLGFVGKISDIRIYNKTLNEKEILNMYNEALVGNTFDLTNAKLRNSIDDYLYTYIFSDLFPQGDSNKFINTNNSSFKFESIPESKIKELNSANDCLNTCKNMKNCTSYSFDQKNNICYNYKNIFPQNVYENVPNVVSGYSLNYPFDFTLLNNNQQNVISKSLSNIFLKNNFSLNDNINIKKCLNINNNNEKTLFKTDAKCIYDEFNKNKMKLINVYEEDKYNEKSEYTKNMNDDLINKIKTSFYESLSKFINSLKITDYIKEYIPPPKPKQVNIQNKPIINQQQTTQQQSIQKTTQQQPQEEINDIILSNDLKSLSNDIIYTIDGNKIEKFTNNESTNIYKNLYNNIILLVLLIIILFIITILYFMKK
jgi:hypothetical protein